MNYDNNTFGSLIKNEINNTPATIQTIQESLEEQLYYGDIEIFDTKANVAVKNHKNIKLEHIIKVSKRKQQRFKF